MPACLTPVPNAYQPIKCLPDYHMPACLPTKCLPAKRLSACLPNACPPAQHPYQMPVQHQYQMPARLPNIPTKCLPNISTACLPAPNGCAGLPNHHTISKVTGAFQTISNCSIEFQNSNLCRPLGNIRSHLRTF